LAKKQQTKQIQPQIGPEKAFGQALRSVREEREISQEALAHECGFDRTYVSLIERGLRSPTVRVVVRLAEILKVKPSELVARMETKLGPSVKEHER
jgi:transcriptional regulator with XRE-family HTH domain